jgi:hypothetical protein
MQKNVDFILRKVNDVFSIINTQVISLAYNVEKTGYRKLSLFCIIFKKTLTLKLIFLVHELVKNNTN